VVGLGDGLFQVSATAAVESFRTGSLAAAASSSRVESSSLMVSTLTAQSHAVPKSAVMASIDSLSDSVAAS